MEMSKQREKYCPSTLFSAQITLKALNIWRKNFHKEIDGNKEGSAA